MPFPGTPREIEQDHHVFDGFDQACKHDYHEETSTLETTYFVNNFALLTGSRAVNPSAPADQRWYRIQGWTYQGTGGVVATKHLTFQSSSAGVTSTAEATLTLRYAPN